MSATRYEGSLVLLNDDEKYKKVLEKRKREKIFHYNTPKIKSLTAEEYAKIKSIPHIWKLGDRLHKLAEAFYDDPNLWWVIAWFNQKPTDAHCEIGDPLYIPVPVEDALYYFNTR